jgi:diguanylate cyclase (GGDEF)-like protein
MPSGVPQGYIMLGRFLTQEAMHKLHDATGTNFTIAPLEIVSTHLQQALRSSDHKIVNHQTSSYLYTNTLISDIYNHSNIVVSLVTPRNLIKQAENSIQNFIVIGITVGIIFLLGALLFMHYIILKPIHTLRKKMNWIIENQTFEPITTSSQNNDEFMDLTENFNSLIEHVIKQNEDLQNLSLIDPLTQLQNRRSLDQYINTLSGLLKREKKNLSIMMIDIDHFKLYNDTYGHMQGDEIIIKVAQVIQEHSSRSSDFVARYGGEEFAVILLDTQLESAKIIAETIRKEVESLMLPHKGSTTAAYVTISVGLASGLLKDKNAVLHLLTEADDALYDAKSYGRNTVATYQATNLESE